MNAELEQCKWCCRRKAIMTTGYLRRWVKPIECKHCKSKSEYDSISLSNCVSLTECSQSQALSSKCLKFWKAKVVFSSMRSLQKYFKKKVNNDNFSQMFECNSTNHKAKVDPINDELDSNSFFRHDSSKCLEVSGHSVLRGHHQHTSEESCHLYCQLSKHGWYWGGISRREAEELLAGQHDNVFLVRDSYNYRHLLCVSFRCVGRTLHTRLCHANGLFSLNNQTFVPINNLTEHCSNINIVTHKYTDVPVRLAKPLNRFAKLDSLQMMCRFVIRQSFTLDAMGKLPLPQNLIKYITTGSDYILEIF